MIPKEAIEAAAQSDAAFDGRGFVGLSAADKRRYRDRASHALTAAFAAMSEPVAWPNRCNESAIEALRYLADNERPNGGEDPFNRAHLLQIASELERIASRPLYAAPQPASTMINPDQWEPCSPDWLRRGGDCANSPRIWNAETMNHWHPKIAAPQPAALAGMPAEREISEGRFEQWTLSDFAGQCRMQARDNLDPEYSQFMAALAARLSAITPVPDLVAENERLKAALTPSAKTRTAYIGEFSFLRTSADEHGNERYERITVPWTTVKDIMKAIREHAAMERT